MIVYVESNFILEIAHLREEHENCDRILNLSVTGEIQLVLPAFSVGEVYEAQTRRAKRRAELHGKLNAELGELARSRPYRDSRDEFTKITKALIVSGEEEGQRLDDAVRRVLAAADIIPIERDTIASAFKLRLTRRLRTQDAIVLASVLAHLAAAGPKPKCFVTRNSKDFANPDIVADLDQSDCELFTSFGEGYGFVIGNAV